MTTDAAAKPARRPVYTDAERSTAKTLVTVLGTARAIEVLREQWGAEHPVPTANTLTAWLNDKAITVDRDLAAAYEAGISITVSSSAQRVMEAAEKALLAALDPKNLDRLGFVEPLLKVWRGATDRMLAAPSAPKDGGGSGGLMLPPPGPLSPGVKYTATYAVSAEPAPAPEPRFEPSTVSVE